MSKYIMRLDDAGIRRDMEKWDRMERLLDKYSVRPLIGVIPNCEDESMDIYPRDEGFEARVKSWHEKGWCIAMHGYNHVYSTGSGGINPMQKRSEFAGEPLEIQNEKIRKGLAFFRSLGIEPQVFFPPSHTFDKNTLKALEDNSSIRIISDTVADSPYMRWGFTFVPMQSGRARELPFSLLTFCYHPNMMSDADFENAESFLLTHSKDFVDFPTAQAERDYSIFDALESRAYFAIRKVKVILKGQKDE